MPPLTEARAGLMRSGDGRSGYPILEGVVARKYALAGVARAGATRSNYHSSAVFVSIAGTQYATGRAAGFAYVEQASLSITDSLDHTPNTARFSTKVVVPVYGQEVIVTLGSRNNREREFGGLIRSVEQSYVGSRLNPTYTVSAIDFTWGMNKRKITGHFTGSGTTIARALIAGYAPGYTSVAVEAGLPTVEGGFTCTNEDLTDALSRLCARISDDCSWYADYYKDVHLFQGAESGVTEPTVINAVHRTMNGFRSTRDLSQVITRATGTFGGGNVLETIAPGETIIPVSTPDWYDPLGGEVEVGAQHVSYTGVDEGAGGSLVGPGAYPSAPPVLALAPGAGIESGAHGYAATFVTAAGESLPSPLASITTGAVADPATAPTAGAPTIGTGPDPGSHDYAVTYVTASGETLVGPVLTKATALTPTPSTAPTPGAATSGGSVDSGLHEYAVGFVTAIGETTPSPISGAVATASESVSPAAVQDPSSGGHTRWNVGDAIYYVVTTTTGGTETAVGATHVMTAIQSDAGPPYASLVTLTNVPDGGDSRRLYRSVNGVWRYTSITGLGGSLTPAMSIVIGTAGTPPDTTAYAGLNTIALSGIPIGDANVTSRTVYRRSGGAGLKLLTTIANNTATTYTDTTANASLGAAPPAVSTAYLQRIPLSAIPTGGPVVTARKIYRTVAGGAQLKLAHTLADNTTTAWTDTVTDAGLGANAPAANTASANQVSLSGIPIGAAAVTARKIYRTVAAGAQLKLQSTIANNTATTLTDATADGALGANVPTLDTSGLTQPEGQVAAGSTEILVAGTGVFRTTGGWAIIGNGQQAVRYSGVTASSLTGIPASGPGAIAAAIGYNSTITAPAQLLGVPASGTGAILQSIVKGEPANIYLAVDDLDAQAVLAGLIGGDGVQEDHQTDSRVAQEEGLARLAARLAAQSAPAVEITYTSRDINTRAGRTATVNLGAPTNVSGTFKIQDVTVTGFAPAINPTYTVKASSTHYRFEDLLRLARKAA